MNWHSSDNVLLLNPRLDPEAREWFQSTWNKNVEGVFDGQVGIATSGSSGESRGSLIMISKSALLVSAEAVNARFSSTSADTWMKALPDFHVGGLGIRARALLSGARVHEYMGEKWDVRAFYNALLESRATLLSLVPTQLFDLVENFEAPPSLRAVIIGGGRLEPELHQRARQKRWPVHASYGLTECSSQVATSIDPDELKLAPLSHVDVRIGSEDRIEIHSGALLTAKIDGQGRMIDPKQKGWFQTEDRGCLERDGTLTVHGRAADFVKVGGEGVSLSRLETKFAALARALRPTEYALLAVHDERLGARIALVTERADEGLVSEVVNEIVSEIVSEFNRGVLPFERIRDVYWVAQIPRSALGKLLRADTAALIGLKLPANH